MHQQLINEAVLDLELSPDGPILIKAGETGGLDPTHPDLEFVRSGRQVFLPGSSLKGVIRTQSERILRTLQPGAGRDGRGACDPLSHNMTCGDRLHQPALQSHDKYRQSCFICRLFGSTAIASRVRFSDALLTDVTSVKIEERSGVAIDRVFGAAVGLFNYEVVTAGTFKTRIVWKNFTLTQLAIIGLALRDLAEQRIALGSGKSRGLGNVEVTWDRLEIRYPLAKLKGQTLDATTLLGVGALLGPAHIDAYGLLATDQVRLPDTLDLQIQDDGWGTLRLKTEDEDQIMEVFRTLMTPWQDVVQHE